MCELQRDFYHGGWYERCYFVGGPRYRPIARPVPVNLIFTF